MQEPTLQAHQIKLTKPPVKDITMEIPISRARLRNYRVNEAALVQMNQSLSKELQTICRKIETTVLTTNDSNYVYRIPEVVKHGEMASQNSPVTLVNTPGFLKELVVALKNAFPDSNIVVDPLETYINIDWS